MAQMKPCPECGSEDVGVDTVPGSGGGMTWCVSCRRCGTRGPAPSGIPQAVCEWDLLPRKGTEPDGAFLSPT